jgi:hypothetical protein
MCALKRTFSTAMLVFLSFPAFALEPQQQDSLQPVLWQDRGDLSKLDMINGPGGAAHQPGAHFKFLKEMPNGTSPKFEVEDENGVRWKVKMGPEARPETAATRLLWAAGYFVDEDYYRREIVVDGLTHLNRGQKFVQHGNTVVDVRLERHHGGSEQLEWDWFENSFSMTSEFNGLRVMMALINNWDLKDVNNDIYKEPFGQVYVVADLGASLGRTGNLFFRTKGNAGEFAGTPFIRKVRGQYVDFVLHSRPFFLGFLFRHEHYVTRTRMEKVVQHIPVDDARWMGNYLGKLSTNQIEDCFRASGFSPKEVEIYSRALTRRIMDLKSL